MSRRRRPRAVTVELRTYEIEPPPGRRFARLSEPRATGSLWESGVPLVRRAALWVML